MSQVAWRPNVYLTILNFEALHDAGAPQPDNRSVRSLSAIARSRTERDGNGLRGGSTSLATATQASTGTSLGESDGRMDSVRVASPREIEKARWN